MKTLRRINWILAATTWVLAALHGLSNLLAWRTGILAWETVWIWSGILWYFGAQVSLLLSVSTLLSGIVAEGAAEKKACVLCGAVVLGISFLVAIPTWLVFQTWGAFG